MEALELPVEEVEEEPQQPTPWLDHDIDLAAFLLWREGSRPDNEPNEEPPIDE